MPEPGVQDAAIQTFTMVEMRTQDAWSHRRPLKLPTESWEAYTPPTDANQL